MTKQKYLPFKEAREYVRGLHFKNQKEFRKWHKSEKPPDIPSTPRRTYKKEWKGWGDWLGTGNIATFNKEILPFEEAKKIVLEHKFKNMEQYQKWVTTKKPPDIPFNPDRVYKNKGWISWGDWLGTGRIANQKRECRLFKEAKEFARSLNLGSLEDWEKYCKSRKKPPDIPSNPDKEYKDEGWKGYPDFLGYEGFWDVKKVKELLRAWIKSGYIYREDQDILFHILTNRGLLNLQGQHGQIFKNLLRGIKTNEGREALEQYVNSDAENPPFGEEEVGIASSEQLAELVEKENETNPLEYGEIKTAEQIFANSETLQSYTEDIESMQFYINRYVNNLWISAFRNEKETVSRVRKEGKNGNEFHDTFVETFLTEYDGTKSIPLPAGYSFPFEPKLMQKYIAYKVKAQKRFGNFSGTGAGKTLSAILASRVIESKLTVIVCPNAIVTQWGKEVERIFPDSVVMTSEEYDKKIFYQRREENKHKYLVINYDKFSLPESGNLLLELVEQKIDFVVLDEIHLTKKRTNTKESIRSKNIEGMLTQIKDKNSDIHVLGMTATPIINELQEGKSLLEVIVGKVFADISPQQNQKNAIALYGKLCLNSVREIPKYPQPHTESINVDIDVRKININIKKLMRNPLLVEQLTLSEKIPEILNQIKGQTIIYTQYVTGIVPEIIKAVRERGLSVAEHTGDNDTGLALFLSKQVQVLVGSSPIATGVDGLQNVCDNLIISVLPWTNAQYQQLVGRLVRLGQENKVNVHLIKAKFVMPGHGEYEYDEQVKWKRILWKKTLADCAVDGIPPEKNMVSPEQATVELVRWLERMERGEISTIQRRDLDVELKPTPIAVQTKGSHYVVSSSCFSPS
jgi:hypothetical protein